jgi:hypothetical protein
VIVLDLKLPDMNGFRVLEHVIEAELPTSVVVVTTEGSFNLYAGFGIDVPLGRRVLIRVSFAPGYYHEGGGKPLGQALEFRSSFEIGWRFRDGWRIGLEGYHLSNADLAAHNPGEGSLVVMLTIPVGSP